MLSCLSESGSASRLPGDEISMERVVNECIKLKKKNKEMKVVILSFEAREKEREDRHEDSIRQLNTAHENEISTLKAQHFIELSQLRDYRIQEVKDLTVQLHISQKNLMNQNPLVVTMSDRIKSLEKDLELTKQALALERADCESRLSPLNKWINEKQTLFSRAIAAESELHQCQLDADSKIKYLKDTIEELQQALTTTSSTVSHASPKKSPIKSPSSRFSSAPTMSAASPTAVTTALAELSKVQSVMDNLKADLVTKQDEVTYYKQENSRLEKQVTLMQMDLTCSSGGDHCGTKRGSGVSGSRAATRDGEVQTDRVTFDPAVVDHLKDGCGSGGSCDLGAGDDMLSGIMCLSSPTMNKSVKPASNKHRRADSSEASSKYAKQLTLITTSTVGADEKEGKGNDKPAHSSLVYFATSDGTTVAGSQAGTIKVYLDKIRELKTQLAEAQRQIAYQRGVIEELVGSKLKVEEGVKEVLSDNRGLSTSLDLMTKECDRLRGELKRYKEQLQQTMTAAVVQ